MVFMSQPKSIAHGSQPAASVLHCLNSAIMNILQKHEKDYLSSKCVGIGTITSEDGLGLLEQSPWSGSLIQSSDFGLAA